MRIAITYNQKRSLAEHDAEFDTPEAIATVAALVADLGHEPILVDVTGPVARVADRLGALAPDRVLNFAEGERGAFREAFYPALFEQLGLPHTGSSASALALCLDKALAKRVVAAARVRVPRGQLVREPGELDPALVPPEAMRGWARPDLSGRAAPPEAVRGWARPDLSGRAAPPEAVRRWIIKPNLEGSSKGITVVTDPAALAPAIAATLARYPAGVLVEELVPGTDVSVGWFAGVGRLPPIRYCYADREVYDYALKHEVPERVYVEVPAVLPPAVAARLDIAAARAFAALGVTGYGRADFRITPGGDVVFLEMNPLPSLTLVTGHDELYAAAAAVGRTPGDLIANVLAA